MNYELVPQVLEKYTVKHSLKQYVTVNKQALSEMTGACQQDEAIILYHLNKSINANIGSFNTSFNNLDQLRLDMYDAKQRTQSIIEATRLLKKYQLENLVKVQRLNQKKINICKTAEVLKFIVILQKSVPVIRELITNSETLGGLKTAMQLIFNANQMIESKMIKINVAQAFQLNIDQLKSLLIQKLETKCIQEV